MPGMTAAETASYVSHHIKLVGRPDQLFTEDALTLIHTTARGYPRAVNNLSLQALVAAFAAVKNLVDEPAARAAVSEVVDYTPAPCPQPATPHRPTPRRNTTGGASLPHHVGSLNAA